MSGFAWYTDFEKFVFYILKCFFNNFWDFSIIMIGKLLMLGWHFSDKGSTSISQVNSLIK